MAAAFQLETRAFGKLRNGYEAMLYLIKHRSGTEFAATNYGAALVSFLSPSLVLGFKNADAYEHDTLNRGLTIGRFANRIQRGHIQIDGHLYSLTQNEGENTLHGGVNTISRQLWQARLIHEETSAGVCFNLVSPDGDNGFPGNLAIETTYLLRADGALHIQFTATTDQTTVINLTNHSYFNLNFPQSVLKYNLQIEADAYLVTDSQLIPTGEIRPVDNTPYDFRKKRAIQKALDHYFVLNDPAKYPTTYPTTWAVDLYSPATRQGVHIYTNAPGVQVYTGQDLPTSFSGIAIECQDFPDAPHHPHFPSTLLRPGDTYFREIILQPYVDKP